ncbi:MAG: hypothetical protein ACYC3O_03590 [Burkholderiales bacterium]
MRSTHGTGASWRISFPMGPINQLKSQVAMLYITHALPKNLLVDEVVRIGQGALSAVNDEHSTLKSEPGSG